MDIKWTLARLTEKGLTQKQIGNEIGCSQPAVSGMSKGKVGKVRPSYKIVEGLKRLALENGVDPDGSETEAAAAPLQ